MFNRQTYSTHEKQMFIEAFQKRKSRQWQISLLGLLFALPLILSVKINRHLKIEALFPYENFMTIIGFVIIAGVLGFSFYNWRCPACSKYLGKNRNPTFCPHCGVPFCEESA